MRDFQLTSTVSKFWTDGAVMAAEPWMLLTGVVSLRAPSSTTAMPPSCNPAAELKSDANNTGVARWKLCTAMSCATPGTDCGPASSADAGGGVSAKVGGVFGCTTVRVAEAEVALAPGVNTWAWKRAPLSASVGVSV